MTGNIKDREADFIVTDLHQDIGVPGLRNSDKSRYSLLKESLHAGLTQVQLLWQRSRSFSVSLR
jgi:hypothetical protein